MELILNPYEGIGNIKIGMTKDEISTILNIIPETFEKSEGEFVDDFKLMHVYYNNQHKSIAFEIFPEIEVKFNKINLTKGKIENLKEVFQEYDRDIEIVIEQEKIMLLSSKKINLMDVELNEFLLAYKNMFNKKIKVVLCENYTGYDY